MVKYRVAGTEGFLCLVCDKLLLRPVVLPCNPRHRVCEACFKVWLQGEREREESARGLQWVRALGVRAEPSDLIVILVL